MLKELRTSKSRSTCASVAVEAGEGAGAAVAAGTAVASVVLADLAEGGSEADGAGTCEGRGLDGGRIDLTDTTVLAPRLRTRVARVSMLAELPDVPRCAAKTKRKFS